jgi:hypothetical protein
MTCIEISLHPSDHRPYIHVCTRIKSSIQVYRARLKGGGEEVAVKVQRPGVVEAIALDTYILRYAAGEGG